MAYGAGQVEARPKALAIYQDSANSSKCLAYCSRLTATITHSFIHSIIRRPFTSFTSFRHSQFAFFARALSAQ